jgi:hypothetical protein
MERFRFSQLNQPSQSELFQEEELSQITRDRQFNVQLDLNKEYQRHKRALCLLSILKDVGFECDLAFCKIFLSLTLKIALSRTKNRDNRSSNKFQITRYQS